MGTSDLRSHARRWLDDIVVGRNPATVEMVIPLITRFCTSQVVQDFFHQQYDRWSICESIWMKFQHTTQFLDIWNLEPRKKSTLPELCMFHKHGMGQTQGSFHLCCGVKTLEMLPSCGLMASWDAMMEWKMASYYCSWKFGMTPLPFVHKNNRYIHTTSPWSRSLVGVFWMSHFSASKHIPVSHISFDSRYLRSSK